MENLELCRKYRPTNFEDVVGNELAIKTLKSELEHGAHMFLMVGPAGCGKTTVARIMANQVGAGPLSIREINSAENRGIDTAREIMEQMRFKPTDGDSLVWILDECHKWTNDMQNAMLKPTEEPPKHVYFFLCTTDPQKLIKALKSRCTVINMKPLTDKEMIYLLKRTAKAEQIKISNEVYQKIAEIAEGGSRDGLKLLSKVLYLDSDEERMEVLESETIEESKESMELCKALCKKTPIKTLLSLLKEIDLSEPERIRQSVMGYMNGCLTKGFISSEVVATMQAFSSADVFKNGKFALTIAILDREDYLSQ